MAATRHRLAPSGPFLPSTDPGQIVWDYIINTREDLVAVVAPVAGVFELPDGGYWWRNKIPLLVGESLHIPEGSVQTHAAQSPGDGPQHPAEITFAHLMLIDGIATLWDFTAEQLGGQPEGVVYAIRVGETGELLANDVTALGVSGGISSAGKVRFANLRATGGVAAIDVSGGSFVGVNADTDDSAGVAVQIIGEDVTDVLVVGFSFQRIGVTNCVFCNAAINAVVEFADGLASVQSEDADGYFVQLANSGIGVAPVKSWTHTGVKSTGNGVAGVQLDSLTVPPQGILVDGCSWLGAGAGVPPMPGVPDWADRDTGADNLLVTVRNCRDAGGAVPETPIVPTRLLSLTPDAPIAANTTATRFAVATGARVGMPVSVLFTNGAVPHGLVIQGAQVTAPNTLAVYISNLTAGPLDPFDQTIWVVY